MDDFVVTIAFLAAAVLAVGLAILGHKRSRRSARALDAKIAADRRTLDGAKHQLLNKIIPEMDARLNRQANEMKVDLMHRVGWSLERIVEETGLTRRYVADEIAKLDAAKRG